MIPPRTLGCWLVVLLAIPGAAQERRTKDPAIGDSPPVLRLEAEGPAAYVTALAFSGDGNTLYAGGHDKVVRAWRRQADGKFAYDRNAAFRIPLGPGGAGMINAVAVSPDGQWLAIAGQAVARGEASFRQDAVVLPASALSPAMREDRGVIYVYHTTTRLAHTLRGHQRPVQSLAFAPTPTNQPPVLASFAAENENGAWRGELALWRVGQSQPVALYSQADGIGAAGRPQLAVDLHRRGGEFPANVVVHLCDDAARLRHWRASQPTLYAEQLPQAVRRAPVVFSRERGASRVAVLSWGIGGPAAIQFHERAGEAWNPLGRAFAADEPLAAAPVTFGGADYIAFLTRSPTTDVGYRLFLFDLKTQQLTSAQGASLWPSSASDNPQPTIAVSADGGTIAVGPRLDQGILVFATQDLLAGRAERQELPPAGPVWQRVDFAAKAGARGLLLDDATGKRWAFDVAGRRFDADLTGWSLQAPNTAGWTVAPRSRQDRQSLDVQGPRAPSSILLEPGQQITSYAWLPPGAAPQIPLVAVAYLDAHQGRPFLALYEATTGTRFRQCDGHTDRILHVAFSRDGRQLASVGKDGLVCVWSLLDVGDVWGQLGQPRGVDVREVEGRLRVDRVAAGAFPRGELQVGDEIASVLVEEKPQPVASAIAFYARFEAVAPGGAVTVVRRRPADASQTRVTIPVAQKTDERRPLFTLFGQPGDPQGRGVGRWVAWSPFGPFDASDRDAERLAGWHVNTGVMETPVAFTGIDQYRNDFYRNDLMQSLLASGRLPAAMLPQPEMRLHVEADGQPVDQNADGAYIVLADRAEVKAVFHGIPHEAIARVQATFAGVQQPFERHPRLPWVWTAEIRATADAPRTQQELRIDYETREAPPRIFDRLVNLDFRLAPPKIELPPNAPLPETTTVVTAPLFDLNAVVAPALAGEPIDAVLYHNEIPVPDVVVEGNIVKSLPKLVPGENRFRLEVRNRNAPADGQALETTRRDFRILRAPEANVAPPPIIVLRSLGAEAADAQTVLLDAPRWEFDVGLKSPDQKIAAVEYRLGNAAFQPLAGPPVNGAWRGSVALSPGTNELTVRVRTPEQTAAETKRFLEYRPKLPNVQLTLAAGQTADLVRGRDPAEVNLVAKMTPTDDPRAYQLELRVNNRVVPVAQPKDVQASQEIPIAVPLDATRTEQDIRLYAKNAWGRTLEAPVRVRYLRPPRVAQVLAPRVPPQGVVTLEQPKVDLELAVESPADLPLHGDGEFLVNGELRRPDAVEREPGDAPRWRVKFEGVPLDPQAGKVEVAVANRDGRSAPHALNYRIQPALGPEPLLLVRGAPENTNRSQIEIQFGVASQKGALQTVGLYLNGRQVLARDLAPDNVTRFPPTGEFQPVTLQLEPGENRLLAEGASVGGKPARKTLSLWYVPDGVQVAIDRLGGVALSAGRLPPMAQGIVTLEGHVTWDNAADPNLQAKNVEVRVFVNGFMQRTFLQPRDFGAQVRRFATDVVLHYPENNRLAVELPGVPQAQGDRSRLEGVACNAPHRVDRLYLLLVSQDVVDGAQLERNAIEALGAAQTEFYRQYRSRAFAQIFPRGPLMGANATSGHLQDELDVIEQLIDAYIQERALKKASQPSVVTMVYYQGRESTDAGNDAFALHVTDSTSNAPQLGAGKLHEMFDRLPSTTLLLLDVAPDRAPLAAKESQWPRESHLALLRARRSEPAASREAELMSVVRRVGEQTNLLSLGRLATELQRLLPGEQRRAALDSRVSPDLEGLVLRQN